VLIFSFAFISKAQNNKVEHTVKVIGTAEMEVAFERFVYA
jgi:hypothetical protein